MITIGCKNPIYVKKTGLIVPCGKCYNCRNKYRLSWQLRLQHEFISYHGSAMFLTLTYNNENLPENRQLLKSDVQLFIKRLRKFYSGVKIKYFIAGEYGDKFKRPHYHAIIYGLRAPEYKKKDSIKNYKYGKFIANKIWKKGFCHVGYVDSKCISYVSKYIMKKFVSNDKFTVPDGFIQPFTLKSSGLGLDWLINHIEHVVDGVKNHKTVKLFNGRVSYPRYYRKKLVEYGIISDRYCLEEYYKQLDCLQESIEDELKSNNIKLDFYRNYTYVGLSKLFTLEAYKIPFFDGSTQSVVLPYNKHYNFNTHKSDPIPIDMLNDILQNHWFFIYVKFRKSVVEQQQKKFSDYNKYRMESEYE